VADVKDIVLALVVGGVVGIALYKFLDPPPPEELIESIANSEWARAWASKFCGGTGAEREECIRELSRRVAYTIAKGMTTL